MSTFLVQTGLSKACDILFDVYNRCLQYRGIPLQHIYTSMVIYFDTIIMVDVSKLFHKGLSHCLIIKTIAASTAQTKIETSRDNGEYCIFQSKKGIWYTWKQEKKRKRKSKYLLDIATSRTRVLVDS